MCTQYSYKYKIMNDDDRMDLVMAERYRAEAEAFELSEKTGKMGVGLRNTT